MMRSNVLLSHPFVANLQQPFVPCPQKRSLASVSHSISTQADASGGMEIPCGPIGIANGLQNDPDQDGAGLPHSVRGAPAHLRQVIRKRQNSESAKRSRLRRKEAAKKFHNHFDEQCKRISMLEKRVRELAELVRREEAIERGELDESEETSHEGSYSVHEELSGSVSGAEENLSVCEQEDPEEQNEEPSRPEHKEEPVRVDGYGQDLTALIDSCIDTEMVGEMFQVFGPGDYM